MSKGLRVWWGKRDRDHMIDYPRSCDGHFMHHVFFNERYDIDGTRLPSLADELADRGYDLETLKFSIQRKAVVESEVTNG